MNQADWLARQFQAHRAHLQAVAYRMLGSPSEADDAVQEAWLRLSRADAGEVANLGGWLTTVVARVAAMLDPDVVLRADRAAVQAGAAGEVHGAQAVADTFTGRAQAARLAPVNGVPGLVWAPAGKPRAVFGFTITGGKIAAIDLLADPERVRRLDVAMLTAGGARPANRPGDAG